VGCLKKKEYTDKSRGMGICWSAPPAVPVATAVPVMAPNSMKDPEKPIYHQYPQQPYPLQYPYPQQQQQYYVQNPYPYPQQQQQQQQQTSPVTAFVGGLLLGSIVEDMLDPFD
jgi:hypothetical protein